MALRAGSVGLGREAGLGARRGWTRRRRPPHARGHPRPGPPPRPFPSGAPTPRARRARAALPPPRRSPSLSLRGGRGGRGGAGARPRRRWRRGAPGGVGLRGEVPRGAPRAHGGPDTRGAGGGGDSGREPGPSRGSPQLRRASRPPPGSPAGGGPVAASGWASAPFPGTRAPVPFPRRDRPRGRGSARRLASAGA